MQQGQLSGSEKDPSARPLVRIAAAQMVSKSGDLPANIATHLGFIEQAATHGIDLLLFPELSLTGYELPLLEGLAQAVIVQAIPALMEESRRLGITVVVGGPDVGPAGEIYIASFLIFPDRKCAVYRKQHLHPGEERFVVAGGTEPMVLPQGDELCALSICADMAHEQHAKAAAEAGATVYLSSALLSLAGYEADSLRLQRRAARLRLAVLLANHGGPSGGWESAGGSAFWSQQGICLAKTPGPGSFLLIATKLPGGRIDDWQCQVLDLQVS